MFVLLSVFVSAAAFWKWAGHFIPNEFCFTWLKASTKIISMLAPTLFSWWKFWKIYPTRIWRNPDYWWIDWQWTLFDSQTQRLKFKLRKHQKSHKGYSIQYVVLRKRDPDYWWKDWNWTLFWFHRPNGWSSKASKKPQRLLDPICTSQEALTLQRDPIQSEKPCIEFSGKPISMHLLMQNITRFRQLESCCTGIPLWRSSSVWKRCCWMCWQTATGKRNVPFWC